MLALAQEALFGISTWSGSMVDYVKILYYTLTKLKPGAYLVPDLSARNHPS